MSDMMKDESYYELKREPKTRLDAGSEKCHKPAKKSRRRKIY